MSRLKDLVIEEEQERPEDYEHELTDELLELPKEQLTDEMLESPKDKVVSILKEAKSYVATSSKWRAGLVLKAYPLIDEAIKILEQQLTDEQLLDLDNTTLSEGE